MLQLYVSSRVYMEYLTPERKPPSAKLSTISDCVHKYRQTVTNLTMMQFIFQTSCKNKEISIFRTKRANSN